MTSINYSLFDNAIHSLIRSIKHAYEAKNEIGEWKFGILLLVQSIELSFKELLFRQHPILIFENIDKHNNKTVSFELAINRLQKISNIPFSESDIKSLRNVIGWRNTIMHYQCNLDILEANKVFYTLISFLTEFYDKYFGISLRELIGDELWFEVLCVEEFVKNVMKRIEIKIKEKNIAEEFIWECKDCNQNTFVIQDDENICYLCGYYEKVVMCDLCNEFKYYDDMKEVYIGNGRGLDAWEKLCINCFEKSYPDY